MSLMTGQQVEAFLRRNAAREVGASTRGGRGFYLGTTGDYVLVRPSADGRHFHMTRHRSARDCGCGG